MEAETEVERKGKREKAIYLANNSVIMMMNQLPVIKSKPTGITILDIRLDGGLPEGSLVCVYANPISMPEVFLYQFASVKKTYYFNTSRPAQYIQRNIILP